MLRNSGRIYLWIGLAVVALAVAVVFGGTGAQASLPSRIAAGPPLPAGQPGKLTVNAPMSANVDTTKPSSPNSILYDQYNNGSGAAVGSQEFGNASDDQAADDFVVPAGPGWRITQVDVNGTYSAGGGPVTQANVYFYNSVVSGTYAIPGSAVYTATNQTTVTGTVGSFIIPLTTPAVLSPGTYFVSVQAGLSTVGQWFWQERTVQTNQKATWRNPPGGFATACNNWDQRTFCIADTAPDQVFRLWGDPVGANTSTPTGTPTASPTRPACGSGGADWIVGNPFPNNVVRGLGVWFPANGKFYSLGGRSSDTAGSDYVNPFEFTPGGQGTWAMKSATFPDNQNNNMVGGVLTVGGTPYIYMMGGNFAGSATVTYAVRRYDPVADVITTITSDPWPQPLSNILPGGFAVFNNKLYVIGGFQVAPAPASGIGDIWEFDPNAPAGSMWTQMQSSLPVPMAYVPATTIGSFIYMAGGDTFDGAGNLNDSNNSYKFDPNADTITPITNIPRATGETRAVNLDGEMWVLGGGRISPNPGNEVDVYNPGTNSWHTAFSFTGPRRNFPADVRPGTNDRIYLVGGYQPTAASSDMQIYAFAAPCIPTFTATRTFTRTPTRTATRTPTCPPVLRVIGRGDPGKPSQPQVQANAKAAVAAAPVSVNARPAARSPQWMDNAPVAFELDDGTHENSIGFGSTTTNTESAAVWLNRFSPPNGAYPITINQIHIVWPQQQGVLTDTIIGKQARLLIYRANAAGAPITNTTLIYQQFVTVGVTETFQTYNLTSPPTIVGVNGEDLYIGFEDFWAESGSFQPRFFPAAEDATAPSQHRSWVVGNGNGAAPNVANLGDPINDTAGVIDDLNPTIPGNWMIRASGITSLPDPCPATRTATATATATPAVTPQLVVHILFQGITAPSARYTTDTLTTTLRLVSGGPDIEYGPVAPDTSGFYTIPVGTVPNGTYTIRSKGHKNLSSGGVSCDTVTLTGGLITQKDLGSLKAGDALPTGPTNFNVVNSSDFTTLKTTFGKSFGQPGYDERADFDQTDVVNSTDFTLQKGNFGSQGCPNP